MGKDFNCEKDSLEMYHCKHCQFKTTFGISFCDHFLIFHAKEKKKPFPPSSAACYLCENCKFSTFSLLLMFKHNLNCEESAKKKQQSNAKYECRYCQYILATNWLLKNHIIRKHTAPENIKWYKCDQCDYKGKIKRDLGVHVKIHKSNNKVFLFYCNYCEYKSRENEDVKRHIIQYHTILEKMRWHQCQHCTFRTKENSSFIRHKKLHMLKKEIKHNSRKNITIYECNYKCNFKTIHKRSLNIHISRRHLTPKDIQWYQCKHCAYKCKLKGVLTRHVKLQHMSKENALFYCDRCDYKSQFKRHLNKHILAKHKRR